MRGHILHDVWLLPFYLELLYLALARLLPVEPSMALRSPGCPESFANWRTVRRWNEQHCCLCSESIGTTLASSRKITVVSHSPLRKCF
jgi:hypothetical protein